MSDHPTADNPTNKLKSHVTNKIIPLDLVNHLFTVSGAYRMWGQGPPVNTNSFELPGAEFTK